MSLWKTLKELLFGAPLKQQFEELLEKEEVKEAAVEVAKKKTTRAKKKK